jgi:hypothetical protein
LLKAVQVDAGEEADVGGPPRREPVRSLFGLAATNIEYSHGHDPFDASYGLATSSDEEVKEDVGYYLIHQRWTYEY